MWYNDIVGAEDPIALLVDYFACPEGEAACLHLACTTIHDRGTQGLPPFTTSDDHSTRAFRMFVDNYKEILCADPHDVARLLEDAWHEGIIGRKLTVHLDNQSNDSWCGECGAYHDNEACPHCGSTLIGRNVTALTDEPYAAIWAGNQQSIDGSSWESDGPHCAYTILTDYPTLVEELRKEGYTLDLSNYCPPESEEEK